MVQFAFNANNVPPSMGGGPQLPVGMGYTGVVENITLEGTRDGKNGKLTILIKATEINGQPYNGYHAWNCNVYHENPDTSRIANEQFSALCHVVGVLNVTDTDQLKGRPFKFDIKQSKDERYTEMAAWYDMQGRKPGQQQQGGVQQTNQNQGQNFGGGNQGGGQPQSNGGGWNNGGGGNGQPQQDPNQGQGGNQGGWNNGQGAGGGQPQNDQGGQGGGGGAPWGNQGQGNGGGNGGGGGGAPWANR